MQVAAHRLAQFFRKCLFRHDTAHGLKFRRPELDSEMDLGVPILRQNHLVPKRKYTTEVALPQTAWVRGNI